MAQTKQGSVNKKSLEREFSAGGAVYKRDGELKWLLIKPAGTDRWQLPKGLIDKGERAEQTAVREVFEETGVKVELIKKADTIQYFYHWKGRKKLKKVTFFLMKYLEGEGEVKEEWKHEVDEVGWFAHKEALEKLSFENERKVLQKAREEIVR